MKVFVQGTGQAVDLTQRDYLGAGGQGAVYVRGSTVYKVYHDPKKMIAAEKIRELAVLTDPHIVRPDQVLVNGRGVPVGYTTRLVKDSRALCQLFPRAFRERESVTHDAIRELVRMIRAGVAHVHDKGLLIVDLNEMNFLVSAGFDDVAFIDVDGYQTPHYAAPALMESVRDWAVKDGQWTALSDWFSFAVVAFQMFVGIHPFKGGYTGKTKGLAHKLPTDDVADAFAVTRRRMQAGISVFHPDVKMPAAVYPLSVIPTEYRRWFEALFAQGKRAPPPIVATPVVVALSATSTIAPGTDLEVIEIESFENPIRAVWSDGAQLVVATDHSLCLAKARVPYEGRALGCAFSPRAHRAVLAVAPRLAPLHPMLYNLTDRVDLPFGGLAREVAAHDGRIYFRTDDQVHEIVLTDAGPQVIASTIPVANVLPYATRLWSGVVIQNMLGSVFVSLLAGPGIARQVRLPELDRCRIIEAKFDGGVLMVVVVRGAVYDRLVFRFADDDTYDVRRVEGVSLTALNFVTLDTGVCVCLGEDEQLEVFSARKGSASTRTIEDPAITGDMILGKMGGALIAARGNRVYQLRMK